MSDKTNFGRTLHQLGFNGSNMPVTDCFAFGSISGCASDCPQLLRGECENQEDALKTISEEGPEVVDEVLEEISRVKGKQS